MAVTSATTGAPVWSDPCHIRTMTSPAMKKCSVGSIVSCMSVLRFVHRHRTTRPVWDRRHSPRGANLLIDQPMQEATKLDRQRLTRESGIVHCDSQQIVDGRKIDRISQFMAVLYRR